MMLLHFMPLPPEALLLDFEGPTGSYLSGDKDVGMEISQVNYADRADLLWCLNSNLPDRPFDELEPRARICCNMTLRKGTSVDYR